MNPKLTRIELIKNQLSSGQTKINYKTNKNPLNKWRKKATIDNEIISNLYFPYHRDIIELANKIIINNPEFQHFYKQDMSMDKIREQTVKQMKVAVKELEKTITYKELRNDPTKFYTFLEVFTGFDQGIGIKFGVHSVLYYNCLKNLSTITHHSYIDRCLTFEDIGCFGLTEFGHGSNVRDIRTTATYDDVHKEFVLNSPSYDAYKWWIGGAGKTANMSCIFAQLYVKGISHGVHCFLVPIRNKQTLLAYPGVILGDCGPKVGNENIDNGFIGFNSYRIPREALLNKYSQVSEEGIFTSSITNPDVRFATSLGALEEGRITIASGSQLLLKNSLIVASRYAALRKQFGREDNEEYPILNYPTTQMRLIPGLAENFAFRFAGFDLVSRWLECIPLLSNPKDDKVVEIHAILSCFKPISTACVQHRIQGCREILGGHGYSRLNMIGVWRNNNDINLTWEGDNTVLIQQTARFIMNNLKRKMKGKEVKFKTLSFLNKFEEVSSAKLSINDAQDLHKDENLISMMEYRINLLVQKCVARLTEKVADKMGVFDAWNDTQAFYLQNLAKSYGELYVLNCFKNRIDQLKDSPTKKVLHNMLVMFALVSLEKDLVLLRENDFILSENCDLIKNEIIKICAVIKPELISIIDAIAPPDEVLQAPLGSSKGFIFDSYLNEVFSANGTFERPEWWEIVHHKSLNK